LKQLIVTADDFGLVREVNDAVEAAHRDGVLTAASLMVAAPAARDAVERARRLPSLRVGLQATEDTIDGGASYGYAAIVSSLEKSRWNWKRLQTSGRPGSLRRTRCGSVNMFATSARISSALAVNPIVLPYDFDILRPSSPGTFGVAVKSDWGSGKTSP